MSKEVSQVFTIANLLTMSRAFLLVPIIIALHNGQNVLALVIMTIGAITDLFDGFVARHFNTVSSFGKVLDPTSDKMVIGTILIYLCAFRGLPWWFFLILLFRDSSIMASAAYLMNAHSKAFQANFSGKVSVNFLALTVILFVLDLDPYKTYVMWIAAAVMVLSWLRYMRVFFIYLKIHLQRKTGSSQHV